MGDAPTLIRIGVQYAGKDACIELLVADGDTPEREAVARELRELSAATVPIEAGMEGEPPFHAGQQFTADVKRIMQKVKTARNERASRMVKQVDRDADAGLGTRRSLQNRPRREVSASYNRCSNGPSRISVGLPAHLDEEAI